MHVQEIRGNCDFRTMKLDPTPLSSLQFREMRGLAFLGLISMTLFDLELPAGLIRLWNPGLVDEDF